MEATVPRSSSLAPALIAPMALPPASRLLVGLALILARWDDRVRSRRALSKLDSHMLRDIGLTDVARQAECRKPAWAA